MATQSATPGPQSSSVLRVMMRLPESVPTRGTSAKRKAMKANSAGYLAPKICMIDRKMKLQTPFASAMVACPMT